MKNDMQEMIQVFLQREWMTGFSEWSIAANDKLLVTDETWKWRSKFGRTWGKEHE